MMDPETVLRQIEPELALWSPRGGPWVVEGRARRQQNSWIFSVRGTGSESRVLVKCCTVPNGEDPDRNTAHRQFESLRRLREANDKGAACDVPTPIALVAELGVLCMQEVDGPDLGRVLSSLTVTQARRIALARQAGAWLRGLHASDPAVSVFLDTGALTGRLPPRLPWAPGRSVWSVAHAALAARAREVAEVAVSSGPLHGDFKPENLLVSVDRLIGIDVELGERGAGLFDIAAFLNHVDLMAMDPRGAGIIRAKGSLSKAFLDGYGRDAGMAVPLAWIRLFVLMGAWVDLPDDRKSRLAFQFMNLCYWVLARRLASVLASSGFHAF